MVDRIAYYEDEYYMLSNFSSHAIEYLGVLYMTPEHAYQAAKFNDQEVKDKVRNARSSFRCKAVARQYEKEFQVSNWNDIRISVMEDILRAKVSQHEDVKEALLKTGNAQIVENSPVDYFWGCGADNTGQNEVGKAWVRVREELKSKKL